LRAFLTYQKEFYIMSRLTSWPSKDGAKPIKDMELNHLYNTIRTLHGYAEDRRRKLLVNGYETKINSRTIMEWIMDMNREIKKRNKVMFY